MSKPAILGGKPVFDKPLPFNLPSLPPKYQLFSAFSKIWQNKILTLGEYTKRLEDYATYYTGARYGVACSSCTSGLLLLLRAIYLLNDEKKKGKKVIFPGFTFTATAAAIIWAGLELLPVDCEEFCFTISPEATEEAIIKNAGKIGAILAVYIFGCPPRIKELQELAEKYEVYLIFDAASGWGSKYNHKLAGNFGLAEVFSLSPTKVTTSLEGGLILTHNSKLEEILRKMRNYGIEEDSYDAKYLGLNARISEIHAAVGLENLKRTDLYIKKRKERMMLYRSLLSSIPGISFQQIKSNNIESSFKDFAILIDENEFGLSRDELAIALNLENIQIKKYFYPFITQQTYYRSLSSSNLSCTQRISRSILQLPFYPDLKKETITKVAEALFRIHQHAPSIKNSKNI